MQRKKSGAKMRVFLFERTDALWREWGLVLVFIKGN